VVLQSIEIFQEIVAACFQNYFLAEEKNPTVKT